MKILHRTLLNNVKFLCMWYVCIYVCMYLSMWWLDLGDGYTAHACWLKVVAELRMTCFYLSWSLVGILYIRKPGTIPLYLWFLPSTFYCPLQTSSLIWFFLFFFERCHNLTIELEAERSTLFAVQKIIIVDQCVSYFEWALSKSLSSLDWRRFLSDR